MLPAKLGVQVAPGRVAERIGKNEVDERMPTGRSQGTKYEPVESRAHLRAPARARTYHDTWFNDSVTLCERAFSTQLEETQPRANGQAHVPLYYDSKNIDISTNKRTRAHVTTIAKAST